jgi:predicted transcriptional regulator
MATAKDEVRQLLEDLPEDASYEDIQYRIYVRQKVENSLAEAERGEVVPHEEASKRLAKWLEP